jgi:mycothiol synthase
MLKTLILRPPKEDDAPQVLALMLRCDIAEYGLPDSDLAELRHDWQQLDLERDAWLVFTRTGDLVGYAAVLPWRQHVRYMLYSDPTWPDEQVGQTLLAQCEIRGLALAAESEESEVRAYTYIPHANSRHQAIVEAAGFRPVNYVFNMQMDLNTPLPTPQWPADVSLRTALPVQDAQAIHRFIQIAFARPDRQSQSFEEWQAALMESSNFDPNLWFLAMAGEELVGACLCFAYAEEGWVRQLGVAPAWRRRGLGAALLHHAFAVFKQRGLERVGLAVEAENQKAYTFYQGVGMKRIRQYDMYEKPLL